MNYIFENKVITFDEAKFLASSKNVVNSGDILVDIFYPKSQGLSTQKIKLDEIWPIVKDIDLTTVYIKMAKNYLKDVSLVITSDFYCVGSNEDLCAYFVAWGFGSGREVDCYVLPETFAQIYGEEMDPNIAESYGIQAPSAVPGMGDVALPEVQSGRINLDAEKGSGDIPTTQKKKRNEDEIKEELYTLKLEHLKMRRNGVEYNENDYETKISLLKSELAECNESTQIKGYYIVEAEFDPNKKDQRYYTKSELLELAKSFDETLIKEEFAPSHEIEEYYYEHGYEKALDKFHYGKRMLDDLEENNPKNKIQEVHFDNVNDVGTLETCINVPVKRRFKQINTPFSCNTLEGITVGKAGDYVVVGVDDEIYPCDKEIFEKTYVKVAEKVHENFNPIEVQIGDKLDKINPTVKKTLEDAFGIKFTN